MNQKLQKFISWSLLLGGLIIIFWSLYSTYNIFTGRTLPPEIFKIEEKKTKTLSLNREKTISNITDLQKEMERIIEEQLKNIVPVKTLTTFLNLISWSIFMGILIFAGSQISTLGIRLMKK